MFTWHERDRLANTRGCLGGRYLEEILWREHTELDAADADDPFVAIAHDTVKKRIQLVISTLIASGGTDEILAAFSKQVRAG